MSMALDPSAIYTSNYYQSSNRTSELEGKLNSSDLSKADDDELLEVCKEFEAYFVEQIFKGMEKMVPKDKETSSSKEVEMFSDKMYQKLAKDTTEHTDFGIAKKLYEQMKRNYGLN